MPTQHIATLLGATCCVRLATVLRCVATCWVLLAQVWNWSNLSRQHPTHRHTVANARNMFRPTMLRHVTLACCDRLAGALQGKFRVDCGSSERNKKYRSSSNSNNNPFSLRVRPEDRRSSNCKYMHLCFLYFVISSLDDMITVLLKITCSERKVERAKCNKTTTCPSINYMYIYFRIF